MDAARAASRRRARSRALLTSLNETAGRVSMHGVREDILRAQADAAGLPLRTIPLPWPCTNEIYEARLRAAVDQAVADGFTHVAFGDLFLEDVRKYREDRLAGTGLTPLFPLWGLPDARAGPRDDRRRPARAPRRRSIPRVMPRELIGAEFDDGAAGRAAARRRSVRRARRVPHLRHGGPDVLDGARNRARRDGRARGLRVRRSTSSSPLTRASLFDDAQVGRRSRPRGHVLRHSHALPGDGQCGRARHCPGVRGDGVGNVAVPGARARHRDPVHGRTS